MFSMEGYSSHEEIVVDQGKYAFLLDTDLQREEVRLYPILTTLAINLLRKSFKIV